MPHRRSARCTQAGTLKIPIRPSLDTIGPTTVLEPRARITLTLTGFGFTPHSTVEVQASTLRGPPVIAEDHITLPITAPALPGTYAINITQPPEEGGQSVSLADAFEVTAANCGALFCGTCETDAQCLDGDGCTADTCESGQCINEPLAACCPDGDCDICTLDADITGNGASNVSDVICTLLVVLWLQTNQTDPIPSCLNRPAQTLDQDCSGNVTVADLLFLIQYKILGQSPPQAIDTNGDGCPNGCGDPL